MSCELSGGFPRCDRFDPPNGGRGITCHRPYQVDRSKSSEAGARPCGQPFTDFPRSPALAAFATKSRSSRALEQAREHRDHQARAPACRPASHRGPAPESGHGIGRFRRARGRADRRPGRLGLRGTEHHLRWARLQCNTRAGTHCHAPCAHASSADVLRPGLRTGERQRLRHRHPRERVPLRHRHDDGDRDSRGSCAVDSNAQRIPQGGLRRFELRTLRRRCFGRVPGSQRLARAGRDLRRRCLRRRQQRLALPRHELCRARALDDDLVRALPLGALPLCAVRPVALAATIAYEQVGIAGLVAFTLPPALMILSVRQYLERTTAAVDEIREANTNLRRAHKDTIAALSRSMEAKDLYTRGHTERVAAVALGLGRRLGFRDDELEAIEIGALLHDIGKIGIPEQILHKAGKLTDDEWALIKTHPVISDQILSELDLHPFVRQCARSSHERIDGTGYPDGLSGEAIPLPARIVFVADALDALTSTRPYRAARPMLAALAEIHEHSGTQFCPLVVAALEELWRKEPGTFGVQPARPVRVA